MLANEVVKSVYAKAGGRLNTSGEGYVQAGIKTSVEDWSDPVALSDSANHYIGKTYATDPAGGAWSEAKVNSLQVGGKLT